MSSFSLVRWSNRRTADLSISRLQTLQSAEVEGYDWPVAPALYHRFAEQRLTDALTDSPVVLVHGPRQCGKTTLARMVGEPAGYAYLSFDAEGDRAAAEADPAGFVAELPARVILDEVQRRSRSRSIVIAGPAASSSPVRPTYSSSPLSPTRWLDGWRSFASIRSLRQRWSAKSPAFSTTSSMTDSASVRSTGSGVISAGACSRGDIRLPSHERRQRDAPHGGGSVALFLERDPGRLRRSGGTRGYAERGPGVVQAVAHNRRRCSR